MLGPANRVSFDRRMRMEIRDAQISLDGGLLSMRELTAITNSDCHHYERDTIQTQTL